jgi:hypothetical protein
MASEVLETVNITEDGGLIKEILRRGEPDAFPSAGDEVTGVLVAKSLRHLDCTVDVDFCGPFP